jgi:hypothetical protein
MPKDIWRLPETCRTLPGLALELLLRDVLHSRRSENTPPTLVEADIAVDGRRVETQRSRTLKDSDSVGVFDLRIADGRVRLRLSEEACRREVYTPRRSSQFLVALQPWEPIRVILNGKADWPSGRYYYLQDYFVLLCDPPLHDALLPVRTFDLQADLI